MPRGKRTRTTRSTATSRRSTRAATRNNSTGTPPGQVVPITAGQPPAPPAPPPAQADFTAFLQVIRNEVRAELEAQRVAASSLPVSTQSQDPLEPANSLPQPQQHPSQQQTPLTTGQQRQSTLQQQAMPIAQTVQPPCTISTHTRDRDSHPHHSPSSPWGHTTTSAVIFGPVVTQNQLSAPSTYQLPQSSYGSGLILSPAEAPVPPQKNCRQDLIWSICGDARIAGRQHLPTRATPQHPRSRQHISGRPITRMRDVLTLPSWLYCFLTYTAILTTDQPTKDKLAYARLMILYRGLSSRTPRLAGLRSLFPATSCRQPFIALEHTLPSTSRHNHPRKFHG